MSTRTRTVVLAAFAVAAVGLGATAVAAALRTPAQEPGHNPPPAPTGPEVAGEPAEHTDPDYWTEERMRGAKPAPMPAPQRQASP
jgi:hypothetical protein